MPELPIYRVVTSASLFDGHDASINIFRRLIQKEGGEVIHLGHNRSVQEIATAAIQEDADAVCVSSYQGGHLEFFKYLRDFLNEQGCRHIRIFGGGGGTILPSEIQDLEKYGITKIYHAEEGIKLGPEGIVKDIFHKMGSRDISVSFFNKIQEKIRFGKILRDEELALAITCLEQGRELALPADKKKGQKMPPVIGVTGSGGAGKSSLVDELINRYLSSTEGRVAILACDPTKQMTGGALLGDRIRMNAIYSPRVFFRSMATRNSALEVGKGVAPALNLLKHAGFDLIILETSGIGQAGSAVTTLADLSLYVMTSEYGASMQLEKIDMIDYADIIAINKFDKIGSEGALDDVRYAFAHAKGKKLTPENREDFPVFPTIASNFNNPGVTNLYIYLMKLLKERSLYPGKVFFERIEKLQQERQFIIIPPHRSFYLGEIAQTVRSYHENTQAKMELASRLGQIHALQNTYQNTFVEEEQKLQQELKGDIPLIEEYQELQKQYNKPEIEYVVRDKVIKKSLVSETLSGTLIPRVALPHYRDWGDILTFMRKENLPGYFPYTAGVFHLKSDTEDPKRQFAGEGSPQRTNKRFHYLCNGEKAKRLSTAFDSVTLYGEDPNDRPDIYGKVGNSGVSIATLDHMKALYKGFDLADLMTSVSLTINGPAPMILAMFLNTAIDFEVEKTTGMNREEIPHEKYQQIKNDVLHRVRGTVQADILKEVQAQNTCIFSSQFALKMMGDIQEYFIEKNIRNFYSVSISGYHIAEAGANPITQLAFTLANGFTYVEYYLARGMPIDSFAHNLSFFFSSGLDPEYSVIGRVARRIWAIAMQQKYGANERSCKLKYHIQTSGRSLHAQEIAFNDVRTTLQALYAISDNCNSLHTNAYDEAITTPTEESVRRAMAIQLILTKEFGLSKCENAVQGSFIYEKLTDLVEEAVLKEFEAISRRGGVMGAMERQYQRHRIQTESMKYEMKKALGELPVIGVNTFLGKENAVDYEDIEVIRASEEEKQMQIDSTKAFINQAGHKNSEALENLRKTVLSGGNIFAELMETVKYASLGQITHLLYSCGGKYRRSM